MAAGRTYTPIARTTLSTASSTVTFSSISGSYTDLVLIVAGGNSRSGNSDSLTIQFNNDTGSNYSNTDLTGNGSVASSARSTSQTFMRIGDVAGASSGLNGLSIVHIMNYANTTTYKTAIGRGNVASDYVEARVGLWRSTSAITSIQILAQGGSASWSVGSTFTLYGIAAA